MLDEVTLTNLDDLFTVRKYDVIPFEMPDKFWVSVTFEMDLNVTHIERKLYTVFDMLSDVGGLLGILTSIAVLLNAIWNYQAFDNFMVSRLFKIKKPREEIDEATDFYSQSEYIKLSMAPNLLNWLLTFVPKPCFCCTSSRKERALQMARDKLDKEVNIIEIVKSWRYFDSAFRFLLDERKRLDLKERTRYLTVDPDPDEEKEKKH